MKLKPEYGQIILRISLALVFLWFGINQLYSPSQWTDFVPDFIGKIIPANTAVILNSSLEVLLGLALLVGFYTRLSALALGVHLFGIALSIGFSAIAIRDYGLALATLALLFLGPDRFCIDSRLNKNSFQAIQKQAEVREINILSP
jgi:uncharacterized membrane protein YphA (DoxX/SURF4 family)